MQNSIQIKRLKNEYAVTRGMIQELIMKCKIMEQHLGDEDCSEDGAIKLEKLMNEFATYKRRMKRIKQELQEIA